MKAVSNRTLNMLQSAEVEKENKDGTRPLSLSDIKNPEITISFKRGSDTIHAKISPHLPSNILNDD